MQRHYTEITVGGSQHYRVTPRIVSPGAVEDFKRKLGICLVDGCTKIAGHDSHRGDSDTGPSVTDPAKAR